MRGWGGWGGGLASQELGNADQMHAFDQAQQFWVSFPGSPLGGSRSLTSQAFALIRADTVVLLVVLLYKTTTTTDTVRETSR